MKQSVTTLIIVLTLLVAPAANAFGASLDNIFGEFKGSENVEYVKIPRFLMWIAGKADYSESVASKIKGLKVLDLSKASDGVRNKFEKRFSELSAEHDTMLSATENGEKVRILTTAKDDKMHDIYIYACDKKELVLVKLSGTFTADDIKAVAEDHEKNKD